MVNVDKIAAEADVILNGYAYTKNGEQIRTLNLNAPDRAAVFTENGVVIETSMDDIEIQIARDYLLSVMKYMEE
jgi:hypothetical protein